MAEDTIISDPAHDPTESETPISSEGEDQLLYGHVPNPSEGGMPVPVVVEDLIIYDPVPELPADNPTSVPNDQ